MLIQALRRLFGVFLNLVFSNNPNQVRQVFIGNRIQFVWAKEHVGRKIILAMFETKETKYLTNALKAGDICLDVGANVGYYANLFSSLVGGGGRVVAVEPVSRNVRLIELASALNGTEDILEVCCVAASDEKKMLHFSLEEDSSYASVQSRSGSNSCSKVVECIRLDALCSDLGIHKVDVLKMDIEGWEFQALVGFDAVLVDPQRRPRLMMVELFSPHLMKYGNSIDGILEYLKPFGYRAYVLNRVGVPIPYEKRHYDKIYNVFFRLALA